jgi:para-nitrobenzyl esterase
VSKFVENVRNMRLIAVLATVCASAWLTLAAAGPSTVTVSSGQLTGVAGRDAGVRVFKGIPFAAPPVGPRRWTAPEPAAAWTGVRAADRFAPACVQNVTGSRLPWTGEFMHQGAVDEDCLYLNVWTAASGRARRPVFVYLYGGGFNEGSGSVAINDGESLARKGLVVVTLNYRVGVFGFLAHPDLAAESRRAASGNYGLLDQVAALRWVQQNIAAFGGDPQNVTIFGESAGSFSVSALMASPLARGLFHRAIGESGAFFPGPSSPLPSLPLAQSEKAGAEFATSLGAATLSDLRAKPVEELV